MSKTLNFTDMSPRTVKIGDTTTSFTLICGNNNMETDLTNATSITVKLGNASGYLKSATVDPASLTDSTADQVTVTFTADLMTSLPAGSYAIEVWVVDSTGTSIYPSDGSTGFTITNNIQSTNGSTITTITFDDFVKAMNKAASTIKGEKGDKGDTGLKGDKGDTGLKGDKGDTPDLSNYTTVTDLSNGLSTKVNVSDTSNWQKQKITNDDGSIIKRLVVSNSDDLNNYLGNLVGGYTTFYVQSGVTNNPSTQSARGFILKETSFNGGADYGIGYLVDNTGSAWSIVVAGSATPTYNLLANDSKVAHLSGANNFDTVPTYGTNNKPFAINDTGATTARPTGQAVGYQYFDTSLNKPIWYTGNNWVDATGKAV